MAYVDKELIVKLKHACVAKYPLSYINGIFALAREIADMPEADVVEVVRCRKCKHAYFKYNMKDTLQEIYACRKRPAGRCHKKVSGDFFCAHGERKDTNEKRKEA